MALIQISEPGCATAPHEHRLAVGIDLGTTNSLIATVRSGMAETLPDEQGQCLLPSVVHYSPGKPPLVGKSAKELATEDPMNTIASVKRLMGRGVDDIKRLAGQLPYRFVKSSSEMPLIKTASGEVSPVEVSAEILKTLRDRAEDSLGGELRGAVITVPAYFDDAQRQATKDAARLAGLHVLRLLNEPTAAALAYGLDKGSEGVYAIYDLGGGTFDISILRFSRGVFEVLATAGDTALGGDDMDRLVAAWLLDQLGIEDDPDHGRLRHLLHTACDAKEALTEKDRVVIEMAANEGGPWQGELTLTTFNELIAPLIKNTLTPCRRALRDAGLGPGDIKGVVMVGGATRVRSVRQQVGQFFGTEPLVDVDPDRVVSMGAAIQADILVGNKPGDDMLLLDVIPLSLGIETMGELVEKVIPRNTTIPVTKAQDFTTFKDGQTAISIHVVQGERELVGDCRSLARFELHGIPPMVAGAARVRVTYQVDADGLLSVTAEELRNGTSSGVEVKPSYGLTDVEIEHMLQDSVSHAKEDVCVRRLKECQVDAEHLIDSLKSALQVDGEALLSDSERQVIDKALEILDKARVGDDYRAIRRAMEKLNQVTEEFAARRMNTTIKQVMAGHQLGEFE